MLYRPFSTAVAASISGAAIGSVIFALGFWLFNGTRDRLVEELAGALFAFAPLAFVVSIVPVLLFVLAFGPVLIKLSRDDERISVTRFFAFLTIGTTLPWLLAGAYGILASAMMLCTYGYPTAAIYLRLQRRPALA